MLLCGAGVAGSEFLRLFLLAQRSCRSCAVESSCLTCAVSSIACGLPRRNFCSTTVFGLWLSVLFGFIGVLFFGQPPTLANMRLSVVCACNRLYLRSLDDNITRILLSCSFSFLRSMCHFGAFWSGECKATHTHAVPESTFFTNCLSLLMNCTPDKYLWNIPDAETCVLTLCTLFESYRLGTAGGFRHHPSLHSVKDQGPGVHCASLSRMCELIEHNSLFCLLEAASNDLFVGY